jgi:hypothetical protein
LFAGTISRGEMRGARGGQIRVEEIGRRRGLEPPGRLHRLVFGKQLERDRRRAVGQLVEEDAQLAAGAIDRAQRGGALVAGQLLDAGELALDLVGEGDHRVEPDHLDRARGLVDVRARVLERRRVVGVIAVDGERLEAARERLVDLALHP